MAINYPVNFSLIVHVLLMAGIMNGNYISIN